MLLLDLGDDLILIVFRRELRDVATRVAEGKRRLDGLRGDAERRGAVAFDHAVQPRERQLDVILDVEDPRYLPQFALEHLRSAPDLLAVQAVQDIRIIAARAVDSAPELIFRRARPAGRSSR